MKAEIQQHVRRQQPGDILRFLAHLPHFFRLYWGLLWDRRVGFFAKALLVGAIVYAVSPLDFLPDWIPVLGQVDDLTLMIMACRAFIRLCPAFAVQEHVARIDATGEWAPYSASNP